MSLIPRSYQVAAITKTSGKIDLKPMFEAVIADDNFVEKIDPYLTNGGVEGDKRYDHLRAMEAAARFDKSGAITAAKLTTKVKVEQFMVVARRHWLFDKHGRVTGVNPKRFMLLTSNAAPSDQQSAEL